MDQETHFDDEPDTGATEDGTAEDGSGTWWRCKLPDGTRPDLPAGYSPSVKLSSTWHAVCRRMICDTAVNDTRSPYCDVGLMGEDKRWLTAVTRYRRRLLSAGKYLVGEDGPSRYLGRSRACTPAGYNDPSRKPRACGHASYCPFCFARNVAECYNALIRCYDRRPTPDHPVWVFARSIGYSHPVAPRDPKGLADRAPAKNPIKVLEAQGAVGGCACRLPLDRLSGGVLVGITDRAGVRRSTPLYPHDYRDRLADALMRYMAFPPGWTRPANLARLIAATAASARVDRAPRAFDNYGQCRVSPPSRATKLVYHSPAKGQR